MNKNIKLVHVGYPKCGSTFLQMQVFQKIKSVRTVSADDSGNPLLKAIPDIIYCDDIYYDGGKMASLISAMPPEINTVSSEGFAGYSSSGSGAGTKVIAKRLHENFPSAKILIIIRNQKSMLNSLYMHDVRLGFACGFDKWFEYCIGTYRSVSLRYSNLISCYHDVFGKENVIVCLFEELFKKESVNGILASAGFGVEGIDEIDFSSKSNSSYSPLAHKITLILNRRIGTKLNCGSGFLYGYWRYRLSKKVNSISAMIGMKNKDFITPEKESEIRRMYHDDNRVLESLLGRKLSDKGYL